MQPYLTCKHYFHCDEAARPKRQSCFVCAMKEYDRKMGRDPAVLCSVSQFYQLG